MDFEQDDDSGTFTLRIKSRSDEHEGMQKKTFTKWINAQLAKAGSGQQVKNLFEDLKDGTKLLLLLEVLCGKRIRSEKGRTRVHFMTNVDNALRILEQNNVRPVNISNDDIVDGNPKLTLGLMWYIISHFQLQLLLKNLMLDSSSDTPEEKLLVWCRQSVRGYDGVEVKNFTTSWRDGLAFNALIHRYRPHLFDYSDQLNKKPVDCCEHAFAVAEQFLDVDRLLEPADVVRDRPDKKSILLYVSNLYNKLAPGVSHVTVQRNGARTMERSEYTHTVSKRTVNSTYHTEHTVKHVKKGYDEREPVRYVTTTCTTVKEPPIQHSAITTVVEQTQNAERPDSMVSETSSVRDSVGSFKEWEDYNSALQEVLNWLSQAERTLESQQPISDDVDTVKKQFHGHEDFMMELTSHQSDVGAVLEFGNQLISEGLVSEKEENEIREQMISLNDRWEALRMAAMDRQTKLHLQLMDLQQKQIDELADWLTVAEKRINSAQTIGSDLDTVRRQVEDHKFFQEDLEKQQQQVNSLTHMVVVVDDSSNESATADLEEQLAVLGERWSNVCKWTEQRWTMLQDVLKSWQEYRDEERRLSKWLSEKEGQIEDNKHIDLGDLEVVKKALKLLINMEQEMEAQQATFGTFNLAAEKVAENLEEESPGVAEIQDKMEEFNDRWNKITTEVSTRIALLEGVDLKLQHFHNEVVDKTQWITDTETLLKSPAFNLDDENISSEKVVQQSELVESLDNARRQRKTSVTSVQRKGEELIEHCRNQGSIPVTLEQSLSNFTERWSSVGSLIDDRRQKAQLARRRRDVQDLMTTLEVVLKDVERVASKFNADVPEIEYEIKSQLELCKVKLEEMATNEVSLIKVRELSRNLSKDDRHTPHLQGGVKRIDDRWSKALATLEDRQKQLTAALESGPPKQFLSTMDSVLLKIKNMETQLASEFLIADTASLEEQLQKYKQLQASMAEQQRNMDYLNSTGDKFVKSLPRQKAEQLRSKLADLNDKWRDINLHAEKRQNQVGKAVNQTRQFTEEIKGLFNWMKDANDFLKDQEPAAGDPETLEAQLDQSEALQGDVTKLQRKLESLNETGAYMISKATPAFADKLKRELDELNGRWDELVRVALRVKDNLVASLEKYQKLSHDIKEMSHWIMKVERSIADDEGDTTSGEITQEKMDHYKELQQDISKRAPVVVRINTTANQMIEKTKQGSTAVLQETIKKLNGDWNRLKTKVAQRQHEFKQTQLELEQLSVLIERDYKLMSELDRVIEKSYHVLEGTEAEIEDTLRSLNRQTATIKESGPGSVPDLSKQLLSKRIAVTVVRKQMDLYEDRLSDIRGKSDKTRQVLEGELQKRQQLRKDLETIRMWVVKIEVLINSKLTKQEDIDEREIKALEEEFSMNQSLMNSVESTCQELSETPKGSAVYPKLLKELQQLQTKWKTIHTKFSELKDQPGKKLEAEFDTLHGQTLTDLDKIQRGLKKLKLESSEPKNVKSLLDKCVSYKDELATIKQDLDQVRKLGFQIMERAPEEKKTGVDRRVEEVIHEHRELEKKVRTKEEAFREALPLAERLESDMSSLERWLDDKTSEVRTREEAGFPEDVDAEIKWNKGLVQEVTGKMSDVQQLTQVGRELVDLSETGQLDNLEDRLTRINNAWEDLSSAAEQRMLTLPKYKAKLADFEKSVDQMNQWLEDMERETNKVHPKEEETDLVKNKIDEIQESIKNREPQLNLIRKQSGEFVSRGRQIMEPYKRLLDRRWDDLSSRIKELEEELEDTKKKAQEARAKGGRVETEIIITERKTVSSKPVGLIDELLQGQERMETDAGQPIVETITTHRTYTTNSAPPPSTGSFTDDDFQRRLDQILSDVKGLEDLLNEIQSPKKSTEKEVNEKIKVAEIQIDNLQPRVAYLLKESKALANREGGAWGDHIHQSMLDLSSRWLKACDELEKQKKAVRIVPNWYQFRSNLDDIDAWLRKMEQDKEEAVQELKLEEVEEQQAKYEMVFKNIKELDRQGVQILSPGEIEKLRKRFKDVHTKFSQYQKPAGDTTSYRITVHTGDVKDAGTQSNVSVVLFGEKGKSPKLRLDKSETYNTKFCRDQLDIFTVYNVPHLGDLRKVQVWHDRTGPKPDWFVKGFYIEDKSTRKVYFFNCSTWIGRDNDMQDIKCEGYTLPDEGEDVMTKSSLARVRWQVTLVEHEPTKSPGWKLVDDMRKLSDEVHEVELLLESRELQKADFEDFSKQEDKLKLIGEKIEDLDPRAPEVLSRSESVQSACNEKEYEAVKRAASKFRLQWNNLNQDYKARLLRWEKAVAVWRQFHCDLKDVTSWMTNAEKVLEDTSGESEFNTAKKEQKGLEDGIARHQSTVNAMNTAGQEIISKSTTIEAEMLRDKLATQNRRWESICNHVTDRRDRFKEEAMQIEEFLEESADMLQWMDEADTILQTKDPSPADEDALEELIEKIKDVQKEQDSREDSKNSIQQTGERLLAKPNISKPNSETIQTRLDILLTRWDILRADIATRTRGVESKVRRVSEFLGSLEELSSWAATTRELLEKQEGGIYNQEIVDPKTVQESLKSRQPKLDSINESMARYRRESKLDGNQVPKPLEAKVKGLNDDWSHIASLTADMFAARVRSPRKLVEETVVEVNQHTLHAEVPIIVEDWSEEKASPWPKFDKAVSELHDWLNTLSNMMKTEKIVLGDSEDMEGLLEKQKSIDEQLKTKQHLLDEIAEMGHTLAEDAQTEEDKFLIDGKVSKLKGHWETIENNSGVWRGQIDYLIEEWKRFVELREELLEWIRKAEAYLNEDENVYGYTVSELEEKIDKHKEFEEDVETWRGSISAVNQCGDHLFQEFPQYESGELKNSMSEVNERWTNITNRSDSHKKNLKEAFDRMVRFHEDMINALTWLTSAESKVAELDSAVEATSTEEQQDTEALKKELKFLEDDINGHQEMFASLNENGQLIMAEMETGDVLTAVQAKLDDMNDRWQSLNVRTLDIRDRLEDTGTEWRQLLMDLQEIIDWIARADQELTLQQPIGGDLESVQHQNENHQAFKGKLNVRRLVVDRALDSARRVMDEYEAERSPEQPKDSPRARIAQNLKRQIDTVSERWSMLSHRSEDWQQWIDEVLRKLQLFLSQMEEIDARLVEAEHVKATWTPVQDLIIDSLSEQIDELKNLQERVASLQNMFETLSSTESELRQKGVSISPSLQNRIDQLYRRWKQLQIQLLQRQHALQEAYSSLDLSSMPGLLGSVEPPWERAVALNKVPYYINHKTETTQWDHPKMTELYHQIAELNNIKYSAYRTAMKLRCIQRASSLDLVTLTNILSSLDQHNLKNAANEALIGVPEMVKVLSTVYDNIEIPADSSMISSEFCVDLTLNWLLNVYDSGRVGKIRVLSFKIGLVTMSRAHLEDKYKYMFRLVADGNGVMDHKKLGLLLHDSLQIPRQLGEIASFGGSNIEPSVRSCFSKAGEKQTIDCAEFIAWLSEEPQSIVWLPTLHRMAASEAVKHKAKCSICKEYPIVGFRFRCLKCFNYDLCQSCFWSGRVSHEHRLTHPMHQYCLSTTSGEDVLDFFAMVRNKFKKRRYKNKPPKKLGYLPIQTVMEGVNLETPSMLSPQQNVNHEVHNRLGMFAHRLAEAESESGKYNPHDLDEEHQLIAQYCQSLKSDTTIAPKSPTQIVMALDAVEKEDLEAELLKLEEENRDLQEEYERLKSIRDQSGVASEDSSDASTGGQQNRDSELLAEAKLLRQHKGRLEARMQVLEDHNRQLEAQLQRLRQLLDQPGQDKSAAQSSERTTPSSSISSLGADTPYPPGKSARSGKSRGNDSDSESEPGGTAPVTSGSATNGFSGHGSEDPALKEVMSQISSSFPADQKGTDPVGHLFATAKDVNKAVESLVQVMTSDDEAD